MKKILSNKKLMIGVIAGVVLVAVGIVLLITLNKKSYRNVIAENYEGSVSLERGEAEVISVEKDMRFLSEDQVTVDGLSLLTMLADEDKHIYVRENTVFKMEAVGSASKGRIALNLVSGQTVIEIENKLSENDAFEVQSPNATISVRGTTFFVDYNTALATTTVAVKEGTVEVAAKNGDTLLLHDGESATITDTATVTGAMTDWQIQKNFDDVMMDSAQVIPTVLPDLYPGDMVSFGEYNGKPIEWYVVERDGTEVVLLSKDVLFEQAYNTEDVETTWETSTLRQYLNNGFYQEAFTRNDQAAMVKCELENLDNPVFGENGIGDFTINADDPMSPVGGNSTEDMVYLLSLEDIEKYFGISPEDFQNTDFGFGEGGSWESYVNKCAIMSGGMLMATDLHGTSHDWWLRSPGSSSFGASRVLEDGAPFLYSNGAVSSLVACPTGGVRPVIRVQAEGDGTGGPSVYRVEKVYSSYVEAYNAVLDNCLSWIGENTKYNLAADSVKDVTYALYDFNLDGTIEMGIELKEGSENYGKWGGDRLLFFVVGYNEVTGLPVCWLSEDNGMYYARACQGKMYYNYIENGNGTIHISLRTVTEAGLGDYESVYDGRWGTGNSPYTPDCNFNETPISDRSLF